MLGWLYSTNQPQGASHAPIIVVALVIPFVIAISWALYEAITEYRRYI